MFELCEKTRAHSSLLYLKNARNGVAVDETPTDCEYQSCSCGKRAVKFFLDSPEPAKYLRLIRFLKRTRHSHSSPQAVDNVLVCRERIPR